MSFDFIVIGQGWLGLRSHVPSYKFQSTFMVVVALQTFLRASQSASWRRESAQWRTRWPPNYIQQPSSGPLVDMDRVGTEEASLHHPASSSRLKADPVPLEYRMAVSGQLLEAKATEVEQQKAQRRARG